MAFPQGVDFRSTAGFVTDPTNFTHDLGTTVYPTASPQGNNIGWVSTTGLAARNRSATVDARLAGMVFGTNIASTFKIDLPAAGTYNIRIALGDDGSTQIGQGIQILDGATVLATPVVYPASTNVGTFDDATGTNYSAANWPSSNTAVQLTFAGTTASFVMGGTGHAGQSWAIASIYIESASVGTTIISNSASPIEALSQLPNDYAINTEFFNSVVLNQGISLEALTSFLMNYNTLAEFLLRISGDDSAFQETQSIKVSNILEPIETRSSLIQLISNESTPIELGSNFIVNSIEPIEIVSANKLVLSNTLLPIETSGNITSHANPSADWGTFQAFNFHGAEEWVLAVKLNSIILNEWQSALLHNSLIQVEFINSIITSTTAPLEYVRSTKLIIGDSVLPVELTISVFGGQGAFDELSQILTHVIPIEEEFAGTPINILLSSIGRLARSVKIRLSESTTKVRLLGPKVRSPR